MAHGGRGVTLTLPARGDSLPSVRTLGWISLAALVLVAGCKEKPALSGKYKGSVSVSYEPTAPGGAAPIGEKAADEVDVAPLDDNKYRVTFGPCSATLKRPEKSYDNKGIWKVVAGGPCATKAGDAQLTGGELIDFGEGSFTVGFKGMTKDEKLSVSWTFITTGR
jgi:hypothetical protein